MNSAIASSTEDRVPEASSRSIWAGRIVSAIPVLALVASAGMKLSRAPSFMAVATGHLGYAEDTIFAIGILELVCIALYAVPRTATLGAVLVTAYLGGAVATHVRVGDPFLVPVVLGVLVWLGLYLRDERVRRLSPLRSPLA